MVATPKKINMEQKKLVKDSTGIEIETDPKLEEQTKTASGLSDVVIRQKFIFKVYGTLTIQMFVVILFVSVILFFMSEMHLMPVFVWMIFFSPILLIPLTFRFKNLRRKAPKNLILLLVLSLCEAVVLGFTIIEGKAPVLLLSAGIILMVTLSMTLFALQNKLEFTTVRGFVLVFAGVLVLDGLLCQALGKILEEVNITGASIFAVCFCLGLVWDTRRLLRIQGKDKLTPHDYVCTAFTIKLDMFNICFLYTVVLAMYIMILLLILLFLLSSFTEFVFGVRLWPGREYVCGGGFYPGSFGYINVWNASTFHMSNDTEWMDWSSEVN